MLRQLLGTACPLVAAALVACTAPESAPGGEGSASQWHDNNPVRLAWTTIDDSDSVYQLRPQGRLTKVDLKLAGPVVVETISFDHNSSWAQFEYQQQSYLVKREATAIQVGHEYLAYDYVADSVYSCPTLLPGERGLFPTERIARSNGIVPVWDVSGEFARITSSPSPLGFISRHCLKNLRPVAAPPDLPWKALVQWPPPTEGFVFNQLPQTIWDAQFLSSAREQIEQHPDDLVWGEVPYSNDGIKRYRVVLPEAARSGDQTTQFFWKEYVPGLSDLVHYQTAGVVDDFDNQVLGLHVVPPTLFLPATVRGPGLLRMWLAGYTSTFNRTRPGWTTLLKAASVQPSGMAVATLHYLLGATDHSPHGKNVVIFPNGGMASFDNEIFNPWVLTPASDVFDYVRESGLQLHERVLLAVANLYAKDPDQILNNWLLPLYNGYIVDDEEAQQVKCLFFGKAELLLHSGGFFPSDHELVQLHQSCGLHVTGG